MSFLDESYQEMEDQTMARNKHLQAEQVIQEEASKGGGTASVLRATQALYQPSAPQDHPALHVIGGKGAQCAWMKTAPRTEFLKQLDLDIAGGSIDIFKCFDQINRHIVFQLARKAGMPTGVLQAYFNYIDNIQVRFQVAETIGVAHHEREAST